MSDGPRPVSVPVHTWMVAYDVTDAKRRRRIAKVLEGFGQRVQYSVFECRLNRVDVAILRRRVFQATDPEIDRVRWYPLCGPCLGRVVQQGEGAIPEDEGYYVV